MRLPKILLALACLVSTTAAAREWPDEILYFALTDRFLDGDPSNNIPEDSDPSLYDPAQEKISSYMGGDLRGMEKALSAGYFNELGITAIWLSPVVRNVWRSGAEGGTAFTGYHGYWTQDFLDIDPHLVSATSLDGETTYPPDRDGRMEHYRDFIRLADSKGIRIIQDVVMNHSGPNFYYDSNGNGVFDIDRRDEWILPYLEEGRYEHAKWAQIPRWNIRPTAPSGPLEILGHQVRASGVLARLETYSRKGFSGGSLGKAEGDQHMLCDFYSLRTFDTSPHSPHFDRLVDEFVEIYRFYLEDLGVAGLRIDTVKHVHHGFWDAFTARLRTRLGETARDKILFGEVYDGDPARLGQYTWRSDRERDSGPALDSVLDFQTCFAAREYLRHPGNHYGTAHALERALRTRTGDDPQGRPYYNPSNGVDGFNARDKMITFIENHDGLNRFRVKDVSESRHRLAQALVLTLPGIPCLYYGAEFGLQDENSAHHHDSENGRLMFFRKRDGPTLDEVRNSPSFRDIAALARLRAAVPVLRTGAVIPLWSDNGDSEEDDGVFAFARVSDDGTDFAVIVMNASTKSGLTRAGAHSLKLPGLLRTEGRTLRARHFFGTGTLPTAAFPAGENLALRAPPESLTVYLPE